MASSCARRGCAAMTPDAAAVMGRRARQQAWQAPCTGRPLRVLHVVHELDFGGLEGLVGAIVRLIDRRRFDSHVLTMSRFGRMAEGLDAFAQLHQVTSIPHLSMLWPRSAIRQDRKSTRLNSSHLVISYAVFCLKKKKISRSGKL